MTNLEDKEIAQYRGLLETPSSFGDGFDFRSVVGCLFIGLVMMPGSMYLGLLAGGTLGPAAQWVTVILFIELARRSFTTLKSPAIFILYYMAGVVVISPFANLLFVQYFVSSSAARAYGLTSLIPAWVAPGPKVLAERTFFVGAWVVPMVLLTVTYLLSRLNVFGLGYVLFRQTSDVERLPFPMAPIGAMGITALAESSSGQATWRWRVFSIGGMLGLIFGFLYLGVPAITATFLRHPIEPLPIPFADFTTNTQGFLPATPMGVSFDLGNVMIGMVLPFSAVIGSFLATVLTWLANPILVHFHQIPNWKPGMGALDTWFQGFIDVYLSVTIGFALAIAIISFYGIAAALRRRKNRAEVLAAPGAAPAEPAWRRLLHPPRGRGDFSLWIGLGIFVGSTIISTVLCKVLVPTFPLWLLLAYGFGYTPIMSYVAARVEGMAGQWVDIPYVQQATFVLAHKIGYTGAGIWYAPIPMANYAGQVVQFRTQELTGTKISSLIKAELVMFPVVVIGSIVFSQYLLRIAPIPSPAYPYAQQYWPLLAKLQAFWMSGTLAGGHSALLHAFKWPYVVGSMGAGLLLYMALAGWGAPVMLVYGLLRGLGAGLMFGAIPQLLGAFLGRYYMQKKFGVTPWRQYAPVLAAGFACGVGLVASLSLGFDLVAKAVFQLPY